VEVGRKQHGRADQAADHRGEDHRTGVAHAENRAGRQRAEDESEDREHDPEQAVAEETGHGSANQQNNGRGELIGCGKHLGQLGLWALGSGLSG
jgi:hypothetical protein